MEAGRGAVLLGEAAGQQARAMPRLLSRLGEPLVPSSWRTALLLEEATLPDGSPLFPDAPCPAQLLGEVVPEPERAWYHMLPGPDLGAELAWLDPRELGNEGLVEAVRAHGRMIAHHEAQMSAMVAELAWRPIYQQCGNPEERPHDALRAAAGEVSLAMSWTPAYADARVAHAVRLAKALPATLAALGEGRIDAYRARVIDEETAALGDDLESVREVEVAALGRTKSKTGPALRAFVKRRVMAAAPATAEERRQAAHQARRVDKPFSERDGMGSMQVYGPIEDLAALFTAVDAAARANRDAATRDASDHVDRPDGTASLATLRFDVLADLGWSALAAGHLGCCGEHCPAAHQRLGSQHGRPATVNVTVPVTTLAGLSDEPAELPGFGPITAEAARRIAADGSLLRMLTDPVTGQLLDFGTTRYAPPQHLADHVIARDRTCRFPTCSWPAEASQLDHTEPHRADGTGGPTSASNFGPLHGRHHNDKTHHGFEFTQPEPGRFVIITPAGLTYQVDPEIIGPAPDQLDPADSSGSDPPDVYDEEIDHPPF